jgi:preprotein translocase SecF subunit
MIDLVGKRFIFLLVSILIIIPGLIAILTGGLKPGIDFTGGTRLTVAPIQQNASPQQFRDALTSVGHGEALIKSGSIGEGANITNTITMDIPGLAELPDVERADERSEIARALIQANLVPGREQQVSRAVMTTATLTPSPQVTATLAISPSATLTGTGTTAEATATAAPAAPPTETVNRWVIDETSVIDDITIGPTVGRELLGRSFLAVLLASAAILIYLTLVFRKVPNAFRYGVCAVLAVLHDVLVVVGIFAILGHLFGTEIDALFITAMLTVIGFSVHDTIVVFDRTRENIMRRRFERFEDVVNYSLVQTLARSINTSTVVLLTLFALYLFGGVSIRNFVLTLLIGIISGTFSSIFTASMMLVVWERREWRGPRRDVPAAPVAPRRAGAR